MSPDTRRSRDVICPFYMADTPLSINCEGPFDGCRRVQLLFCGMEKNETHIREFCCKYYKFCEVYRMVFEAKYNL